MMSSFLGIVWSVPFMAGLVAGGVLMKAYQFHHCRQLDKSHPLPDGKRRHVSGISQQWLGGLMAAFVLIYALVQFDQTDERYRNLAENVSRCQRESTQIARVRADITAANDKLSVDQRDLLTDLDDANGALIRLLFARPTTGDQAAWTANFQTVAHRAEVLRFQINGIRAEQTRLTAERTAHPPPVETCGQG